MSECDRRDQREPVRHRAVEELGVQIAATGIHVGGGSAAAAAASLAAASAELVVTLSVRKSTPADTKARLKSDRERLIELRSALLDAADEDELALERLMQAYRSRGADMRPLLADAAESAVTVARLSADVVEIAASNLKVASRFTVSDLGSAATIAGGCVEAALLTAEVNSELLADQAAPTAVDKLKAEIQALRASSSRSVERAVAVTRARISNSDGDAA